MRAPVATPYPAMFHVERTHGDGWLEVRYAGDCWRFECWDHGGRPYATGVRATFELALAEARRWG